MVVIIVIIIVTIVLVVVIVHKSSEHLVSDRQDPLEADPYLSLRGGGQLTITCRNLPC